MPFAASLSQHPVPAVATGEVVGEVLETIGGAVDLAVVIVGRGTAGALEDVARAVQSVLHPVAMIGCATDGVLGPGQEVEEGPAISLFAASTGAAHVQRVPAGSTVGDPPFEPRAAVVLADPFSGPLDAVLDDLARRWPALPVIGGLAAGALGLGGTRLLCDEQVVVDGAVVAFLGGSVRGEAVVAQGARPVGAPWTVTRAQGNLVQELAGRPAVERLVDLVEDLSPHEAAIVRQGLRLGLVVDEHLDTFERGDFLVRPVLGTERSTGALAIDGRVELGSSVQFHVFDALTADEDLLALLADRRADGVLAFRSVDRGFRLFGDVDHEALTIADLLGAPMAGAATAGEVGSVGGRPFVHSQAASLLLLRDER